jgi:hypothetical protein
VQGIGNDKRQEAAQGHNKKRHNTMGWFDWVLLGLQLLWALLFVLIWFWSEEVGLAVDASDRHVQSLEAQIHKLKSELESLRDRSEVSERSPIDHLSVSAAAGTRRLGRR